VKFENPEMIIVVAEQRETSYGPEDCSARWAGGCCYKE